MKMKTLFTTLLTGYLAATAAGAQDRLVFQGKPGPGAGRHIVLIAGDEEYRTEESCPMLAKILSQRHGFDCTVLFSLDPTGKYIDPNNQRSVSRIDALAKADLLIIGTRFRRWAPEEYQYLADFLNAGKPVIGFRTATHAFTGDGATGDFKWSEFGLKILGETWISHHGRHKVEGTRGVIEGKNARHPVLNSVKDVFGPSDVYGVKNLDESKATVLLRGAVTETLDPASKPIAGPKNDPMMPIAWLREYTAPNGTTKGRSFCTTMGASTDFTSEDLRRLVVNATYHLLDLPVPAKANVDYVDEYQPSPYGFIRDGEFFKNRNLRVSDFDLGKSASTGEPGKVPAPAAPATPKQDRQKKQKKTEAKADDLPSYEKPTPAAGKPAAVKLPLSPGKGESIALVGNMLGERMLYFGHFETALHQRFPQHRLLVRNLCNPGDTPGFRASPSRTTQWAFPGAEKFHPDKQAHFGKGHYPSPDEWLHEVKADTILGFFGFNESFDGPAGVDNFKAELAAWIDYTQTLAYNGKSAPRAGHAHRL
jgi:hypothetical protein